MRTKSLILSAAIATVFAACGGLDPAQENIGSEGRSVMTLPTSFALPTFPPAPTSSPAPSGTCKETKPLCGPGITVNCCQANGVGCDCPHTTVVVSPPPSPLDPATASCANPKAEPDGVCFRHTEATQACNARCLSAGLINPEWQAWKSREAVRIKMRQTGCNGVVNLDGSCSPAPGFGSYPVKNLGQPISTSPLQQQSTASVDMDPEPPKVDWARCEGFHFKECEDMSAWGKRCHECTKPQCGFLKWLGCGVKTVGCAFSCASSFGVGCPICVGALACDCLQCFGASIENSPVCAALEGLSYVPL